MSQDGITIFKSGSSSGSSSTDYLKDAFGDFTLSPSSNSGLTSSAATNPLGFSFADDETTKFGAKTLYVKSLNLIEDRNKWVSNQPTYEIEWDKKFAAVKGYCWGNVDTLIYKNDEGTDRKKTPLIILKTQNSGIAVTSVARRVAFITLGQNISATADQMQVDAANTVSSDYASVVAGEIGINQSKFVLNVSNSADSSRDIHDFRLVPNSANTSTVRVFGVVVSFDETNIDQFPGVSYVNKTKVTVGTGATMTPPVYGSSMGGNALVYKTADGYTLSAFNASCITSVANGTSGTNLLAVSVGQGGSFMAGHYFVAAQGTSHLYGIVQSVSTDTLTVFPTLMFGISSAVANLYTCGYSSATASINSSLFCLSESIDLNLIRGSTFNSGTHIVAAFEGTGKWALWGAAFGSTRMMLPNDGSGLFDPLLNGYNSLGATVPTANFVRKESLQALVAFGGTFSKLTIEGRFAACEFEFINPKQVGTTSYLSFSCMVNGIPSYAVQGNTAGFVKHVLYTNGNNGWNNVSITTGVSSNTIWAVSKINLYERNFNQSVSFGRLAHIPANQAVVNRASQSASFIAPGTYQRIYGTQFNLTGNWVLNIDCDLPGINAWVGSTTNCVFKQQYYGSNFAIIGHTGSSSATLLIDGVQRGATLNVMHSAAIGWHSVVYQASATTIIAAFDYMRPNAEIVSLQKFGIGGDRSKKKIRVPITTSWASYNPSITATTTNPAKGVVNKDSARWKRVGDSIILRYDYIQASGGNDGSGSYLFSLPPGMVMDLEKLSYDASGIAIVGEGLVSDNTSFGGASTTKIVLFARDQFNIAGFLTSVSGTALQNINDTWGSATTPWTFGAGGWRFSFKTDPIPILGLDEFEEIEVLVG